MISIRKIFKLRLLFFYMKKILTREERDKKVKRNQLIIG